jgi:hypothetical protein
MSLRSRIGTLFEAALRWPAHAYLRLFPIIASAYRAENFIPNLQTTLFDWFSSVRSSDAELGVELLLELMSIAGFRQDALVHDLDLQEVLLDMLKVCLVVELFATCLSFLAKREATPNRVYRWHRFVLVAPSSMPH